MGWRLTRKGDSWAIEGCLFEEGRLVTALSIENINALAARRHLADNGVDGDAIVVAFEELLTGRHSVAFFNDRGALAYLRGKGRLHD